MTVEISRQMREAAAELLARRQARESLLDYIAYCELGFTPAAHHRLILRELEAVERGAVPRLMVCLPPGAGKSHYVSMVFPAWFLGRNPKKSIIAASHTQELAERFGRRVRNIYASPAHRNVFGVGIAADSGAAGRWETEPGGEYFATGVGGSVAGRRADLGIIDDPVRSREDADSDLRRERVWEWYINDFVPRLKPGAGQIVVSTRWHEDDLAGRLLEREAGMWRVIELPMEALPDDPLGRKPGERLWPEWFTAEMVETAKKDVRAWNALYQQRPACEQGDFFKLEWFAAFARFSNPDLKYYGASDYAVTEGGGDYTEHGIFALDPMGMIYVVDWWRGQTAPDVWIERQCDLIRRYRPLCWFGEAGPIRRAVEPYLLRRMNERQTYCRLEWLPSVHDKATRCRAFQALASIGRVMVLAEAPWRAELLGQLTRFPAGRYDDGVDVCSLLGRGLEMLPPALSASEQSGGRRLHQVEYDPFAAVWGRERASGGGGHPYHYNYGPSDGEQRPLDRSRFADQIEMLKQRTTMGR
jgi:predicted phage terminase large subunit-like protein